MALSGEETKADLRVLRSLEARFGKPIVCFIPIAQPTDETNGYWHFRVKDHTGVGFVRQNGIGELLMYGPVLSELLQEAD